MDGLDGGFYGEILFVKPSEKILYGYSPENFIQRPIYYGIYRVRRLAYEFAYFTV